MKAVGSGKVMCNRLRRRVNWGRTSLPVVAGVTLVNQLLLAMGVNYHFLLGAAVPYYASWMLQELGIRGVMPILASALAVVTCMGYLICWGVSRRRRGGLSVALGLYGLDTLLLIVFAFTVLTDPAACILEILTHLALLVLLSVGAGAERRLGRQSGRTQGSAKTGTFSKAK